MEHYSFRERITKPPIIEEEELKAVHYRLEERGNETVLITYDPREDKNNSLTSEMFDLSNILKYKDDSQFIDCPPFFSGDPMQDLVKLREITNKFANEYADLVNTLSANNSQTVSNNQSTD